MIRMDQLGVSIPIELTSSDDVNSEDNLSLDYLQYHYYIAFSFLVKAHTSMNRGLICLSGKNKTTKV